MPILKMEHFKHKDDFASQGVMTKVVELTSSREMCALLIGGDGAWWQSMREVLEGTLQDPANELVRADAAMPTSIRFVQVATPEEAMRVCLSLHPDLVLISLTMGDSDVRALCRSIRQRDGSRHTGIIVYTNHVIVEEDGDPISAAMLDAGADDVVFAWTGPSVMRARARAVIRLKRMTDELRYANHRLKMLSLTDDLTGLANMRSFSTRFQRALRRTRAGQQGMAVIMLDIDHFKSVNDTNNHLVGSATIRAIGQAIRATAALSDDDVVARYGGDEFVLFVEADSLDEATEKGEAIRRRVRETHVRFDDVVVRVTASVGVAFAPPRCEISSEQLVKAADLMLYQSKEGGRDRVTSAAAEDVLEHPPKLAKIVGL